MHERLFGTGLPPGIPSSNTLRDNRELNHRQVNLRENPTTLFTHPHHHPAPNEHDFCDGVWPAGGFAVFLFHLFLRDWNIFYILEPFDDSPRC